MLVGLILIVVTTAFFILDAALTGIAELTGFGDLVILSYDSTLYMLVSSGMHVLFMVGLVMFAIAVYLKLRDLPRGAAAEEESRP